MRPIPLNLLSLYADIAQRRKLQDIPAGSISRKQIAGRQNLYAVTKIGKERQQIYLGLADTTEAQEKAAAHRRAARIRAELKKSVLALKRAGIRSDHEHRRRCDL
jgi:hypothetical protein